MAEPNPNAPQQPERAMSSPPLAPESSAPPPPLNPPLLATEALASPAPAQRSGGEFFRQAARASWGGPLVVLLFGLLGSAAGLQGTGRMILGIASALIILLGLVFGIAALAGVSRHGRRGILIPAPAGLLLNGLLIMFIAATIPAARRAADAQRQQAMQAARQKE